jgi:hypothetical protein
MKITPTLALPRKGGGISEEAFSDETDFHEAAGQ